MKRLVQGIALAVLIATGLSGCMQVVSTGASTVYNRHSIQESLNDQLATFRAYQIIHKKQEFLNTNVAITTYHGDMLVAGQVPEAWQRNKIDRLLRSVPDIDHIYNLLTISSPSSTLTRVSDAWITSKVKAKLLASDEVDASKVKVITENGTVYLMGVVPEPEADTAVDIASNTDGVARVVRVFSYMTISKKRQHA